MGAKDDFALWEKELGRDWRESTDAADDRSGSRGIVLVASMVALGCTVLIMIGDAPLGAAGLVVSGLILLLWRTGW